MSPRRALLQIAWLLAVTTIAEFSGWSGAGWLALGFAIVMALYWIKMGRQRWLVYFIIVLTIFPETQSNTIAGLELHHIIAAVVAISVIGSWIVVRPMQLPRLSRLLILYAFLAAIATLVHAPELENPHRLFVVGLFILVALLIPFVVKTKRHILEFFGVVVAALVVSFAVGLAAYYVAALQGGLFSNPYIHISTVEGVPRIAATLLDSNFFGHYLLLIIPGLLLLVQKTSGSSKKIYLASFAVLVVVLAGLWLTYSRSAYLGLGAALLVVFVFLKNRPWKQTLKVLIASLALATVLVPSFVFFSIYRVPSTLLSSSTKETLLLGFNPRALVDQYIEDVRSNPLLSEEERDQLLARDVSSESLGYRIEFWRAGLAMFKDHPIVGVGVGQFRYRFDEYSDLQFIREPDVHNIFIEQLAETGIIGSLGLLAVLAYAIGFLSRQILRDQNRIFSVALLASLIGLLVQSMLLGGLGTLPLYVVLGAISVYSPNAPFITRRKGIAATTRVIYVTATTKKDGPGNVLFYQIRGMDRKKIEPIVITVLSGGGWDSEYKKIGVRRINLGLRKPLDLITPFVLWPMLWRLKPDLVQTQMIRGDIYGRWAAMRVGVPYISVVHNMDIWKQTRRWFHRFATWFDAQGLAHAARIVTVSEAVKQHISTRQGIRPSAIEVIPNAIDIEKFSQKHAAAELSALRASLQIPPGAAVVLTVARVHQQKAPEVWLMAAARVLKKYPKARFVWVGDGPLLAQIKSMVPRELKSAILFVGKRRNVPLILHMSDIFVLPSRFEGLPTVLIEAMSAGIACVATNVSGNPELIKHNQRGLLVAPNQAQVLARAIERLLNNKDLRERLGRTAQEYALIHFTVERMSASYQSLTLQVVQQ